MIVTQEIQTANDVLKLSAEDAKRWIKEVLAGKRKVADNFNWHGLAEYAGSYAQNEKRFINNKPDLAWSEISISVYEKLANEYQPDGYQSFMDSAMIHRAWAILQYDAKADDYILDPEILVRYHYDHLKYSYKETLERINEYQSLGLKKFVEVFGLETLREMRRMKHRLRPLRMLVEKGFYEPNDDLARWLKIQMQLP